MVSQRQPQVRAHQLYENLSRALRHSWLGTLPTVPDQASGHDFSRTGVLLDFSLLRLHFRSASEEMKLDELPKEILERIVEEVCRVEMGPPDWRRADWRRLEERKAEQKILLRLAKVNKAFSEITTPQLYGRPYEIRTQNDTLSSPVPLLRTLREMTNLAALVHEIMLSDRDLDNLGLGTASMPSGFIETLSGLPKLYHFRYSPTQVDASRWTRMNALLRQRQLFRKFTFEGNWISIITMHAGSTMEGLPQLVQALPLDCLVISGMFHISRAEAVGGPAYWDGDQGTTSLDTSINTLGQIGRYKHLVLNGCRISEPQLAILLDASSHYLERLSFESVELEKPNSAACLSAGSALLYLELDETTYYPSNLVPRLPPKCAILVFKTAHPKLPVLGKFCSWLSAILSNKTCGHQLETVEYHEQGAFVRRKGSEADIKAAELCDALCRRSGIRQIPARGFAARAKEMLAELQEEQASN